MHACAPPLRLMLTEARECVGSPVISISYKLLAIIWVLGIYPGFTGRIVSTLN